MYFPYLRGRQYELIALRELLENNKLGSAVIPIIEPVRLSPTLVSTLEGFKDKRQKCSIVMNPSVGSFLEEYSDVSESENFYYVSLMSKDYSLEDNFKSIADIGKQITVCKKPDDLQGYNKNYMNQETAYNFISEIGRLKREVQGNKVKIIDNFVKLARNTDYSDKDDEFFSDDHKYFIKDEYKGFSDYSIVGEEYSESGFAPYAVAIHIVYFDSDENLRIHHFVSESNQDPTNPAGKFKEALEKLITFVSEGRVERTLAINEFEKLYKTGSYPGLGTVKKLSIMHHIELVSKYLDRSSGDSE